MDNFSKHSLNDIWRAIVMRGNNVASYKFALAESLIKLSTKGISFVSLEELAIPFSEATCRHILKVKKQITNPNPGKFLNACKAYNKGTIKKEELIQITTKHAFNDVIDRFHIVNRTKMGKSFYIDDRKTKKGLTITDEMFSLHEGFQFQNFPNELEARWRLVETAWFLNIAPNLLVVEYDDSLKYLNINQIDKEEYKRNPVTSCKDALNAYQQGLCFYCSHKISVKEKSKYLADVDHFFPHSLIKNQMKINVDGVWNLVLACKDCNRGENGKFSKIPENIFLDKLCKRNNWLISSHKPLRETIINQTGNNSEKRVKYLSNIYEEAIKLFPYSKWSPK